MRIHDSNLTGASAAGATPETQRGGAAAGKTAAGVRTDRVEISEAAESISRAFTADGADRAERIRHLTAEYQSGRLRPDAAATSRAMVEDALAAA